MFIPYVPAGITKVGKVGKTVGKIAEKTCDVKSASKAASNLPKLVNGMKVTERQALDMADDFLGKGYKEIAPGVFRSKDGLRQVRMTEADILGSHAGGAHMNFEVGKLAPMPNRSGMTFEVEKNIHIFLAK